jgi:TonB family protein
MRTGFAILFVGLGLIAGACSAGAATKKDKRRAVMIYKPPITYPYKARREGIKGSGVVALEVDYVSGKVTRAFMLKSTGSAILDDAALSAFRKAKFLPGSFENPIKIPITFGGVPPQRH